MNRTRTVFSLTTTVAVLVFAGSGLANLVRHEHVAADLAIMGYPAFLMSILGVWKVLGAIVVAVPGAARAKEWAYAGMIFDLTGAAISRAVGGFGAMHVAIPLALVGVVATSWALRPASRRLVAPARAPRGLHVAAVAGARR